jgi:hypothetical protein
MSVAPTHDVDLSTITDADLRPWLPIVRLRDVDEERERLRVYFSDHESVVAAAECLPDAEFFDARGYRLAPAVAPPGVKVVDGRAIDAGGPSLHLQLTGEPDGEALKRRLIAVVSGFAACAEGADAAELEANAAWLATAPSAEYAVHGLGVAPVRYDMGLALVRRCTHCNANQRRTRSDCCPG